MKHHGASVGHSQRTDCQCGNSCLSWWETSLTPDKLCSPFAWLFTTWSKVTAWESIWLTVLAYLHLVNKVLIPQIRRNSCNSIAKTRTKNTNKNSKGIQMDISPTKTDKCPMGEEKGFNIPNQLEDENPNHNDGTRQWHMIKVWPWKHRAESSNLIPIPHIPGAVPSAISFVIPMAQHNVKFLDHHNQRGMNTTSKCLTYSSQHTSNGNQGRGHSLVYNFTPCQDALLPKEQ